MARTRANDESPPGGKSYTYRIQTGIRTRTTVLMSITVLRCRQTVHTRIDQCAIARSGERYNPQGIDPLAGGRAPSCGNTPLEPRGQWPRSTGMQSTRCSEAFGLLISGHAGGQRAGTSHSGN